MWLLLRGEGLNLGRLNILLAIKLREMYVRIILQQWLCRVLVTLSSASSLLDLRSSATPSSTSPLSSGGSLLDTMYQDTISFEMHVFTLPYIFSTPATRDCVHSVSTVHPWRSSSTISPPETMRQWWNNSICNFTFSIITRLKKKQSLKTSSAWEQLTQYKRQLSSWAWDLEPMVRNNQRFVNLVHVDSSSWLPVPGYLHSPCQMIICSGLLEKVWTRWLETEESVSPLPKYLVPRAIASTGFKSSLSLDEYVCGYPHISANSFFYGAQKQYFSPHDMMTTQVRYRRQSKRSCCCRNWYY